MTPPHSYGYHQSSVSRTGISAVNAYNPPRPVEVYHLSDAANHSIPEDIREKFHRDECGRILFFTAPPLDPLPPIKKGDAVGHSVRYLARKQKHMEAMQLKRKRDQEAYEAEAETRKKAKREEEERLGAQVAELKEKAIGMLEQQMVDATVRMYKKRYGERVREGMMLELDVLEKAQDREKARLVEVERSERKRKEREFVSLKGPGVFLDDIDARF
jgi:chromatin structure-remodeling complex subunit RSC1/2